MGRIIIEEQLAKAINSSKIVKNGDVSCAEGIKYDFRLGKRFLKSYFGRPVDYDQLPITEQRMAKIEPGEVVFVLTEESLCLPDNVYVQLSPKRKLSHAGIHLLGGFTVDPGYQGYLLFGLYNLSSTPFPLIPGRKLVGAVFYELDEKEMAEFDNTPEPLEDFPDELVRIIKEYEPVAIKSVVDDLKKLREAVESDSNWKKAFQEGLDKNQDTLEKNIGLINKIAQNLQTEIDSRKLGEETLKNNDNRLESSVRSIEKSVTTITVWAKVLMGIVGVLLTVGSGLLIAWLTGILNL